MELNQHFSLIVSLSNKLPSLLSTGWFQEEIQAWIDIYIFLSGSQSKMIYNLPRFLWYMFA